MARRSLRKVGTLTMTVLSAALSAIAMAANGKASGSLLIEAVPSPCPAAPMVRPRATW